MCPNYVEEIMEHPKDAAHVPPMVTDEEIARIGALINLQPRVLTASISIPSFPTATSIGF
jgi:hypothetical protein